MQVNIVKLCFYANVFQMLDNSKASPVGTVVQAVMESLAEDWVFVIDAPGGL